MPDQTGGLNEAYRSLQLLIMYWAVYILVAISTLRPLCKH